ncbi:hypothetical protein LCGC14_1023780 [marine sediment metagenome]|uniref:Uncharacterized protein n=1 Tax=marine sediment metagenome TaxID=412755 RepID=A0A0F9QEN6_9ZZZZ
MAVQKQTRFIRKLIYTLKKGYGFQVTFYKVTNETLNLETGARTPTIIYQKVNKAIILPSDLQRKFESDSTDKGFNYGAYYDTALRKLIVDPRDLGDFNIDTDDYFIVEGERFQVVRAFKLYNSTAILVLGRHVEGSKRYMITDAHIESTLIVEQTIGEA